MLLPVSDDCLANRIARLKVEEERLEKRIAQTASRTGQIVSSKERHQADLSYKEQVRAENDYIVEMHRQHLNETRKERKDNKAAAKEQQAAAMSMLGVPLHPKG